MLETTEAVAAVAIILPSIVTLLREFNNGIPAVLRVFPLTERVAAVSADPVLVITFFTGIEVAITAVWADGSAAGRRTGAVTALNNNRRRGTSGTACTGKLRELFANETVRSANGVAIGIIGAGAEVAGTEGGGRGG